MKAKKTIALILVMVMVLGLLTVTASATPAGSLSSPTNGIKSITISGANINNNEDRTLTGSSAPYNLTYNVKLASGTADGTVVTATFEKENASNENLVVSSAKPNSILNAVRQRQDLWYLRHQLPAGGCQQPDHGQRHADSLWRPRVSHDRTGALHEL